LFETPHFALSLEVREIDPALSWKKNSIHLRLRTK
jgi:5-carboxymethyl-2-hydroxymuconate isomerase